MHVPALACQEWQLTTCYPEQVP